MNSGAFTADKAGELFRLAVEAAPNGMIMIGADGAIVLANAQTEQVFGYAKEELVGQAVEILVPERFRPRHPEHRQGFFAAPQARSMGVGRDLYGLRKDGREFPVEIGLNPLQTEAGRFVLASIIDITERKRAEERFRLVVEAAPNGMIMIGGDGKIVLANAQTQKLFGYTKEELIGQPVEMLVPVRFRPGHPHHRLGFFAAPQARAMGTGRDFYGLRKDGSEVPVEIGLNPLATEAGPMVLAAIIDITERKRAEEALRLARDQLELRVQKRTTELAELNQALRAENSQRQEAVVALAQLAKELKEQRRAALNIARDADEARKRAERNEEALRRSEERTQQTAAELARSNAELELFASVASHDLQEPLRMVSSYVDLLAQRYQGKLDEKADRWITYAVEGAGRMKRLIDDLLDFSRVSSRGKPLEATDSAAVFNEVVENLQKAIQESGAQVTCGPLPSVNADATQLAQLLQNLIGNAIKFRGAQRPEVRVAAERKAGHWLFSVRDNGIGLDGQFAERIFVIFQRLHTREEYPGTGIGLALCKKIVERHGGRIWVDSQPGQGSTFYFTIPDRKDGKHAAARQTG